MDGGLGIGVMGAGAVGCYVGGRLAAAGERVVLVGRERLRSEIDEAGLTLTDLADATVRVPDAFLAVDTRPDALAACRVILCCVKSAQTAEVAESLARILSPGAVVVSLQNGVHNADVLRARLRDHLVLGGIVGFNVVPRGKGVFRRATTGPLVIEHADDARVTSLASALARAGLEVELARDVQALQWAKLVMNLNNAVSALSDVPTKVMIFDGGYRRIIGAIVAEALAVMRRAGIRPGKLGAVPVGLFPFVLRLPTPILRLVARAQLQIDPEARSSMWEDLARGRPTEVDYLNGEIVRLAESCGAGAPLNRRVVEIVHEAERRGGGSPKLSADALWGELARAH